MRTRSQYSRTAELKRLLPSVDVVARDLYSVQFKRRIARCPFPRNHAHGDRDPSLHFDKAKNRLFCASQNCLGAGGADAFGLVQTMDSCNFVQAKKKLSDYYGLTANAGETQAEGRRASKSTSANGRLITANRMRAKLARDGFRVVAEHPFGDRVRKVRFEHQSKKQASKDRPEKTFRWEHLAEDVWYSGDGDLPKPLYVNDSFRKLGQVSLAVGFEGEGKADLAGGMGIAAFSFKDITAEPAAALADYDVVLWPDNDRSGIAQAKSAAEIIHASGQARTIKLLTPPADFPPAGDIMDAVQQLHWNPSQVSQFLGTASCFRPEQSSDDPSPEPDGDQRFPFRVSDAGVFFLKEGSDGSIDSIKLSSRVDVVAETCDANGGNWGRLLRWQDNERRTHEWAMPMDLLASDASSMRARLLGDGLPFITTNNRLRDRFTEYLQTAPTGKRMRSVSRIGWHETSYVLPDQVFGAQAEQEVLYQASHETAHQWGVSGSAEEWRAEVGTLCAGNSRLIISVSCGFGGPLLSLVKGESGGIHFYGGTSTGKSTALAVGGSVCGGGGQAGFVQNWRNTINGLEAVAEAHNDSTLFLDELAQADPRDAAETAYLLANGQGKGRMTRSMGIRRKLTWTLLFVSAGEITLAEHAATAGKRTKGGAEVRLLNIQADAGKNLGLFETLHGASSPDAFARQLKASTQRTYGAPYRTYLAKLTQHRTGAADFVGSARTAIKQIIPPGSTGEVGRAADRFAIIGAAGELATQWGLTGWAEGEATQAAHHCFQEWLRDRGTTGSSDVEAGINRVRTFIAVHGTSRFQSLVRTSSESADLDGYPIMSAII